MRYLLLLAWFIGGALHAQQLHQHPALLLLGPDLAAVGNTQLGGGHYAGLGHLAYLDNNSLLLGRRFGLSWVPGFDTPNAWGQLLQPQYKDRQVTIHSNAQGLLGGNVNYRFNTDELVHHLSGAGQFFDPNQDHNEDGFRDEAGNQFGRFHYANHWLSNPWEIATNWGYQVQKRWGGQTDYRPQQHEGSDSIYGYQYDDALWYGQVRVKRAFGDHQLTSELTGQQFRREGILGQRKLRGQEAHWGMKLAYTYEEAGQRLRASVRQYWTPLEHEIGGWQQQQHWRNFRSSINYRRFHGDRWVGEIGLHLDRHTLNGWSILPIARIDYLSKNKFRLGLLAGRDYRLVRVLEESQVFWLDQRNWAVTEAPLALQWYAGAIAKTEVLKWGDDWLQQFKL
ncbi:MAG: hypothetical protein AAGJ82_03005, partial [Bacteroidota bacterium]